MTRLLNATEDGQQRSTEERFGDFVVSEQTVVWRGNLVGGLSKQQNQALRVLIRGEATDSAIFEAIWPGQKLNPNRPEFKKHLNRIQQLISSLRQRIGKAAISKHGEQYVLSHADFKLPGREPPQEPLSRGQSTSSVPGGILLGHLLDKQLYSAKAGSDRIVLWGVDPLRRLLQKPDRLLSALRRQQFWIIANDQQRTAHSLARLAKHVGGNEKEAQLVSTNLRITFSAAPVDVDRAIIPANPPVEVVFHRVDNAAFCIAEGPEVLESRGLQLQRTPIERNGPVVQHQVRDGQLEARIEFATAFKMHCTVDNDILERLISAWFPLPVKPPRKPNGATPANLTQESRAIG